MLQARGVLTLAADESVVLAEASGLFLPLPNGVIDDLLQNFPGLRNFMRQDS
jgi:hypothetical protein